MSKFIITGGTKLFGKVNVPCAKNSYLPILAASILSQGTVVLHNCPHFLDIENMLSIIEELGCTVSRKKDLLILDCKNINNISISPQKAGKIRSSIFLLGPLLARMNNAIISYPGGCNIGNRPIDLHLKGLQQLNVEINERYGQLFCKTNKLIGNDIHLDFPSVGATENIMLAATLAKGITRIFNVAKEPEIIDLQNFVNKMGGKISGAGSDTIIIEGVKRLGSVEYTPIADRIIAGTYLLAGASCGGDILIENVNYSHIYPLVAKLKESNFDLLVNDDSIRIKSNGKHSCFDKIDTLPYPGFPTDLQSQSLVLQTISKGSCVITENLFETRFQIVPELIKMKANITSKGRHAFVRGVPYLQGAEVFASDLRSGAGLTIAGMVAEGKTIIHNVEVMDRGYEYLDKTFNMLGANIIREE